jgi:hypothetical protein
MKNKSKQSAFFNQPVLIGLFIVLAGVFLALLGLGTFSHAFAQGQGKTIIAQAGQATVWSARQTLDSPNNKVPNIPDPHALTAREAGRSFPSTYVIDDGTAADAPTDALWYNGDYDGDATGNGLANEQDTFAPGFAHVFDDFIVTDSGGWDITSVFSNNQMSTVATSATFEIRQGMSPGNGGTLVASGSTDTPVITPTGRFGFGLPEFTVEITGLSVHLDPGTYWLNVTPVDNLDGGRSFNSTTLGANCVGTPCGNDQNAFFDSDIFGFVFEPTLNICPQCGDFSMGVNGTVSGGTPTPTPTPGELVLKLNERRGNDRVLVRLRWTGATTPAVKIFRNGARIATVPSTPNTYTDTLTDPGIFTYQVCESVAGGTGTCSNEKNVRGP